MSFETEASHVRPKTMMQMNKNIPSTMSEKMTSRSQFSQQITKEGKREEFKLSWRHMVVASISETKKTAVQVMKYKTELRIDFANRPELFHLAMTSN